MKTYLVTLLWSGGHFAQLDVPASDPRIATKRAWFAAISPQLQWFDLPYEDVDFEVFDEDDDTNGTEPVLVIFDNAVLTPTN